MVKRTDDAVETPLRANPSLESDDSVCWIKNNEVVTVLSTIEVDTVTFAYIETAKKERGYIKHAYALPWTEQRASRSRA